MITDEQVRRFHACGYLLLEQAAQPALCQEVRAFIRELRGGQRRAGFFKNDAPNAPLFGSHLQEPLMMNLVCQAPIRDALAQLLGAPPLICQSMFFFAGSRTKPHQDEFFMAPDPLPLIGSWIALQDVGVEDGPLGVVPGSHLGPVTLARDVLGQWWKEPAAYERMLERVGAYTDRSRGVPLTARLGDVLFFHGRLIHWGMDPATPERPRWSFVSHHCRADAVVDDSNNGLPVKAIAMG